MSHPPPPLTTSWLSHSSPSQHSAVVSWCFHSSTALCSVYSCTHYTAYSCTLYAVYSSTALCSVYSCTHYTAYSCTLYALYSCTQRRGKRGIKERLSFKNPCNSGEGMRVNFVIYYDQYINKQHTSSAICVSLLSQKIS